MAEPSVAVGDRVDIISGPFRGGRAMVLGVDQNGVHVEMLVLGQPTPFTVHPNQVKRAALQMEMTDTDHLHVHRHI